MGTENKKKAEKNDFWYLLWKFPHLLLLPQFERVRVIYKYALDRIPKQQAQELFKFYTMFEKKFGDRRGIEDVIVSKRRFQYEEEVKVHRPIGPRRQHFSCRE